MIQEIKIKNFLSFKDETVFSFEASGDQFAQSQVVTINENTRLLRFAIIYGYNASGKSNLLKVLDFLAHFWFAKSKGLDEKTGVVPFKLDSTSPGEHSCFEIIFYVQDTKYWYQLELDQKQVYLEKLSYYKTTQPIMLFERTLKGGQSDVQINPNGDKISPAAKDQINVNCLRNISFFVARNLVNASLPTIDAAMDWMRYHLMPIISPVTSLTINPKKETNWLTKSLTSVLLAAPASMSAPSELSAKATSTRSTRTLALAAVPELALAPLALSRRVNRPQIRKRKAHACVGLLFMKRIVFILIFFALGFGATAQWERLQSGDLLFVRDTSGMGLAVQQTTGQYTHVALVERVGDSLYIIDATPTLGVTRRPITTFGPLSSLIEAYCMSAPFDTAAVIARAHSFLGQPYDMAFTHNNNALYCSELIYECYLDSAGNHIFETVPMNWRAPDGTIPTYWIDHFRRLDTPIPEGLPGTNPTGLSLSPLLIKR